jgi:hypothetical protein
VPDNELISFAAVEPLAPAESRRVGRWVERECPVVFRAGDYPDKGFKLSPEELREAVEHFNREVRFANFDLEHVPTLLQNRLGGMTRLKADPDGKTFGASALIPGWFHEEMKGRPIPVSAQFHKATKRIKGFALTCDPRLDGTELLASFSMDAAGNGPMPPPPQAGDDGTGGMAASHGNELAQKIWDAADKAVQDAGGKGEIYSGAYMRWLSKLKALAEQGGAKGGGNDNRSFSREEGSDVDDQQTAEFNRVKAEFDQLRRDNAKLAAELAEVRKKSVVAEAVSFARSDPVRRRVTPDEEASLVAMYVALAEQDHVNFSADPRKPSLLGPFKEQYLKRREHNLGKEMVRTDRNGETLDASFTTPDPVRPGDRPAEDPPDAGRRRSLLEKTELGRKILAEEDAKRNGQAATA